MISIKTNKWLKLKFSFSRRHNKTSCIVWGTFKYTHFHYNRDLRIAFLSCQSASVWRNAIHSRRVFIVIYWLVFSCITHTLADITRRNASQITTYYAQLPVTLFSNLNSPPDMSTFHFTKIKTFQSILHSIDSNEMFHGTQYLVCWRTLRTLNDDIKRTCVPCWDAWYIKNRFSWKGFTPRQTSYYYKYNNINLLNSCYGGCCSSSCC